LGRARPVPLFIPVLERALLVAAVADGCVTGAGKEREQSKGGGGCLPRSHLAGHPRCGQRGDGGHPLGPRAPFWGRRKGEARRGWGQAVVK
uniref:Uncharacterized protein n=1 Tax=Malurus cyaneus samueli TaxID=2593467 RepID=A0A8C5XA60_9PASS